jgi:hypothetical protein
MNIVYNGYKDPDQNLLSYALEMGLTVEGIANGKTGPVTALKTFKKQYAAAKFSYLATGLLGGAGLLAGIGVAGIFSPLAVSGALVVAMGSFGVWRNAKGVEFNQTEEEFFRAYPTTLKGLAIAIKRGLPAEVVVSIYEELLSMHSQQRTITSEAFQRVIAEKANAAIASYKASDSASTAFTNGQELEVKAAPLADDDLDIEDDFDDETADPEANLPPFLRTTAIAAAGEASPKPNGVVGHSATAAPSVSRDGVVAILERTLGAVAPMGLPQSLIAATIDRPYSTFIFGQSSAGKDITLFNIMGGLKVKFPTAYFLGIDGKNHPTESAMWDLYDESIRISMLDHPRDYHDRLLAALDKAVRWPGRAFVGFSEVNGISGVYAVAGMAEEWKRIAHLISFLSVQGNADGKFLYATAQALNLDSLGLRKDSRANCAFMAIANSTQFSFLSQIAGDTKVFQNKLILDQQVFQSACSRSTATQHLKNHNIVKGIGWFHTDLNRWEPMPRLVNPGPDRGEAPEPPIDVEPLPDEWEAIGRAMIATTFTPTFETPGTINSDGTKESIAKGDAIEQALLTYLGNRPGQKKQPRDILAAKIKALERLKSEDIKDYLECLSREEKIFQDGSFFYL